ncbi:MAG: hypothetical protein IPG71_09385 [bacterium]|jgi:hypothetical protein|nr:hypothetical protein [bacterium]
MRKYVTDTEWATRQLIALVYDEKKRLSLFQTQLDHIKKTRDFLYWDFSSSDLQEDFIDSQVQFKYVKLAEYVKNTQPLYEETKEQVTEIEEHIANLDQSYRVICGAILQIAKQGISTVHGRLHKCPTGRPIGSTALSVVIWQARNQTMHYEMNKYDPPVCDCFAILERECGPQFSLASHGEENLAHHVIELLGWTDYSAFETDMFSLA